MQEAYRPRRTTILALFEVGEEGGEGWYPCPFQWGWEGGYPCHDWGQGEEGYPCPGQGGRGREGTWSRHHPSLILPHPSLVNKLKTLPSAILRMRAVMTLDTNCTGRTVFRQAGLALQYMDHVSKQRGTKAMVLAGDLNTSPQYPAYEFIKTGKLNGPVKQKLKEKTKLEDIDDPVSKLNTHTHVNT